MKTNNNNNKINNNQKQHSPSICHFFSNYNQRPQKVDLFPHYSTTNCIVSSIKRQHRHTPSNIFYQQTMNEIIYYGSDNAAQVND